MPRGDVVPDAVIVCGIEDARRGELWRDVLLRAGANQVAVFENEEMGSIADADGNSRYCFWTDVKGAVPVVLVHQANGAYWHNQVESRAVLWFDTPGTPAGREGDLRIVRQTGVNSFEITVDDGTEILDYGRGERKDLPACCLPRRSAICLPALAILCQGYLVAFAKEAEGTVELEVRGALDRMGWDAKRHRALVKASFSSVAVCDWWLRGLGIRRDTTVSGCSGSDAVSWDAFRTAAAREWGKDPIPPELSALLERIADPGSIEQPFLVARAYRAIAEHLNATR